MSYKTRSNYKVGVCLRFSCVNRGDFCDGCVRFSRYSVGNGVVSGCEE